MVLIMKNFVLMVVGILSITASIFHKAFSKNNYDPTHDSVAQHSMPEWYQDAKFGVIIHYGLYSVPGWATLYDPSGKIFTKEFFFNNPYAEWYANTMQIKNSPTFNYHTITYGKDFKYDDFIKPFNAALTQWQPDEWSKLFVDAGVKYVVFVTKHHDGFLLWPSVHPNPFKQNFKVDRDIVNELTVSVKNHGMRMGLYYSGGYDWSWSKEENPILDLNSAIQKIPQSAEYAKYVSNHYAELMTRYHPDLLWNDIALPGATDKWKIIADFYNQNPSGVINNRWGQGKNFDFTLFGQPLDVLIDLQLTKDWFDYYSPEYLPSYRLTRHVWEADHGPGYSFGYNQEEYLHPAHLKTLDQIIQDLADLVSKNGNLLLGIGPAADGSIPAYQRQLLLGIGKWLSINDEAIFATRPWLVAEGKANGGDIDVRFTMSKNKKYLYVILLKNPLGHDVTINNFVPRFKNIVVLAGNSKKIYVPVKTKQSGINFKILLQNEIDIPKKQPLVIRIEL